MKIENSRIYLECDDINPYCKEMSKVVVLNLDKHVIIWDQSKQEQKITNEEIFDIYLDMNKIDQVGNKIFDREIWGSLVKDNLSRAEFAQLGCWKNELELLDEINSTCEILDVVDYCEQIELFVKLTESLRELITSRYLDSYGNIKWFNFALYNSSDKESPVLVSSHYGAEIYIYHMNTEDVEKAITTVEHNDVYVRINRHHLFNKD